MSEADERARVYPHGGWVTIAVAALGIAGTLGSGAIGYQSGALSVNKDYVQMAMRTLSDDSASPELRRWSVEVLNELAPIPLDEELRDQLVVNRFVTFDPPEGLRKRCPDLLNRERAKERRRPDDELAAAFILAYEECRLRYDGLLKWHEDIGRELEAVDINSLIENGTN